MAKTVDDYVAKLSGWQAETAIALRAAILAGGEVKEGLKWSHPFYDAGGPVCLFQAYPKHITLAFWRGADMLDLNSSLARSGSFEMAQMKLTGPNQIGADDIHKLVTAGVALNREKGDPLKTVKKK